MQPESLCPAHRQARERGRGTRQQRGYGVEHDRLRAQWKPRVATGNVRCSRCSKLIAASEPWDLGHDDHDRTKWNGPEHEACNRATTGRR
ncbi:hypothetical protein CH296_11150 [Rhodococcus sp. 14-2496-1d]|nr:hypothetical protein CH296_11150 [Rhodococcus sp. 14-2496-1d]